MGKFSGVFMSIVGMGILAFIVYYCCLRRKRQRNGTVIQVTGTRVPPATPNVLPYNPTNPGLVGQYFGYPYPAANYVGQPYPGQNVSSYPTAYAPPSGQPMPMPMPPVPQESALNVQGLAPYPNAPPMPYDDLPPPYSDVTKR